MGFMDELKKLAKPYTEDEDDFDEFDDDVRPTRASRSSSAPAPSRAPSFDLDDTDDDASSSFSSSNASTRRTPGNNKVVNIHTTAQMQVVLVKLWLLLSLPRLTEPVRTVRLPRALESVSAVWLFGAKPPKIVSWQLSAMISAPSLP